MGRSSADVLAQHGIAVDEETLEHYGVPGMRWGKRKARKEARAEFAKNKAEMKTLSDDDLKARINRLKLEKEYKTLITPEISAGKKIVGKILSDVGQQAAKNYINREINSLMTPGGLKMTTKLAVAAAPKAAAKPVMQFNKTFSGKI